jgi:hypothetical protein
MTKHNKKRNVGIIYELLLRQISRGIIDEDSSASKKATEILKKHFEPGTQLYREFRLFNALVKTTASSDGVASTILSEARMMAASIDRDELNQEKSMLIQEINHELERESFYKQWVPDYRMYATIQTLLNDWRNPRDKNLGRMAEYESQVKKWLLQEKVETSIEEQRDPKADKLVVKIMSEKINKKYGKILNESQREILSSYVLFAGNGDIDGLRNYLEELRESTLAELDNYLLKESNSTLNAKASKVRQDVLSIKTDDITDETIGRFMTIAHLRKTLKEDVK